MRRTTSADLNAIRCRGNRLAARSEDLFKQLKPLFEKGTTVKEISYHIDFSRDYITHLLEGIEDIGLIYKRRVGRYYHWFINDVEDTYENERGNT